MWKEVLIAVGSFIAGWAAPKLLDFMYSWGKTKIKLLNNNYYIKKLKDEEVPDILQLEAGWPCFYSNNVKIKIDHTEDIFFAFPEADRDQLLIDESTFKHNDILPENSISLNGYTIQQLDEYLENAKQEVARKFILRTDGLLFNGQRYGVSYIGESRTADDEENPVLLLKVYNTDYYTERVISTVLNKVKANLPPINLNVLNGEMKWTRNSLGLSIIVIIPSTNEIIMTYRTAEASFSENRNWIYVSVTETLTETDYDPELHAPSLNICLMRGITEELGITKDKLNEQTIRFYDTFYETNFHQDGIVCSIELREDIEMKDIIDLPAKDKKLECSSVFTIRNTQKSIEEYINDHKKEMRSQTLFALKSYAARL